MQYGYPVTIYSNKSDILNYKIYGNTVQEEGTPSPNNPLEIKSVGDKTINLFDLPTSVTEGSSNITLIENGVKPLSNVRCTFKNVTIPDLEVGKTYTCKVDVEGYTTGSSGQLIYTDGTNHTYLRQAGGNETVRTFTLTEGVEYNQLWFYGENTQYTNIMIVEGEYTLDNFPEYEPYGKYKIQVTVNNNKTNIFLDEPLRKIGEYEDYIDFREQKIYRFVGETDFSSSSFKVQNTDLGNEYYRTGYMTTSPNMIKGTALEGFCNVLPVNNGSWSVPNSENIRFGQVNTVIYLYTKNTYETKEELLSYLGDIHVNYILASRQEEPIELPKLPIVKGENLIKTTTEISPSNIEIEYYKED